MDTEATSYEVVLSLGSLVYLAGLIGFCGGLPFGLVGAIFSLAEADFIMALASLLLVPLSVAACFVLYACIGYPIYARVSKRTPKARELTGLLAKTNGTTTPAL